MIAQRDCTASQWFDRAEQSYTDNHQACPWCEQQHCLFRRRWGGRLEFHCTGCDFSTCQEDRSGQHYWFPGQD